MRSVRLCGSDRQTGTGCRYSRNSSAPAAAYSLYSVTPSAAALRPVPRPASHRRKHLQRPRKNRQRAGLRRRLRVFVKNPDLTPCRASSQAIVSPTGPAPFTITRRRFQSIHSLSLGNRCALYSPQQHTPFPAPSWNAIQIAPHLAQTAKGLRHIPNSYMPASRPRDDRAATAIAAVREVYTDLAARPVERNCIRRTECCQFRHTGYTPWLTDAEALVAVKAFRATGRTRLPEPADGSCPMLDARTGRCLIYADRPFACRTHFCEAAGGPYSRRDVLDLIRRLESISAPLAEMAPPNRLRPALSYVIRTQHLNAPCT
jgi:Fe-S-cluster containining protein